MSIPKSAIFCALHDTALTMSTDFLASMAARLDEEPVYISVSLAAASRRVVRRFVLPSMVAAAVAAAAFIISSQIIVANSPSPATPQLARTDEYLLVHQRFSPFLYSAAQYTCSATFAPDSDK